MSKTNLVENENIYIDCNPVDIIGNVVEDTNYEEKDSSISLANRIKNPSDNFNTNIITNNLGFQFTIAITIFAFIYGLGNYVFKTIPNNMLEKRISNF